MHPTSTADHQQQQRQHQRSNNPNSKSSCGGSCLLSTACRQQGSVSACWREGTLLGIIHIVVDHGISTNGLLGRSRMYRQMVGSSSDSDLTDDEDSRPGLPYDEAAIDVLVQAAAAFIDLHASSDTKQAATEALLQHERGAGLLLELCKCRYLWWDKDLGYGAQVALFEILQQCDEFPAGLESFLQARGVTYVLKLLEDGLDWASDWDDSDDGADEQTMRAVIAAADLAATAAGRAALENRGVVECLLQMSYAGDEQSGECSDHVYMYASLALVRLAADERCRAIIEAQGGLPGFLQAMADEGLSDEEVQQRLEEAAH